MRETVLSAAAGLIIVFQGNNEFVLPKMMIIGDIFDYGVYLSENGAIFYSSFIFSELVEP